jgi:hypothetical protein
MTRFYVNEREIVPPSGTTTFEDILKHVDETELPPDSVIRQVNIDGDPILQEDLSKDTSEIFSKMERGEKVEIFTGTVDEILSDSISEAFTYLERAEEGILVLARNFQSDPGPESFQGLSQLCEGFYWLNLLLSKLSDNFAIVLDDVIVQGVPAGEHHRKFLTVLKELLDSQEKRDLVLISDLLEYEIAPMVSLWKEMFQVIAEKVTAKR